MNINYSKRSHNSRCAAKSAAWFIAAVSCLCLALSQFAWFTPCAYAVIEYRARRPDKVQEQGRPPLVGVSKINAVNALTINLKLLDDAWKISGIIRRLSVEGNFKPAANLNLNINTATNSSFTIAPNKARELYLALVQQTKFTGGKLEDTAQISRLKNLIGFAERENKDLKVSILGQDIRLEVLTGAPPREPSTPIAQEPPQPKAGPPPAENVAPIQPQSSGTFADKIQETILSMGYTQDRGVPGKEYIDTANILGKLRSWGITENFLQDLKSKPIDERISSLANFIKKNVTGDINHPFELSKVIDTKEANCLGYSQLFYILGKATDVDVEVISYPSDVTQPGHAANLAKINSNEYVIVDLMKQEPVIATVDFENKYQKVAGTSTFEMKEELEKYPQLKNYYYIQRLNEKGILSAVYSNLGAVSSDGSEKLEYFNKAIALDPKNAYAYYNRADYATRFGTELSIKDYTKAIAIFPGFAQAYYQRGTLYAAEGKYKEAENDYKQAVIRALVQKKSFDEATYYVSWGKAHEAQYDYINAISRYQAAIGLNQEYKKVFKDQIDDYTKQIQKTGPNIAESATGYFMRGILYTALDEKAKARDDLRSASRLKPGLKSTVENIIRMNRLE